MNIISRVQFPKSRETADLCIKVNTGETIDFHQENGKSILHEGSVVSLNTYFNSIYESFYTKYTTLRSLCYLLKLEGSFAISVYREKFGSDIRTLLCSQIFQDCQLSSYVKLILPELKQTDEAGRIYLEMTCLSQEGVFMEGLLVTEQEKQREVSLGIITCTFKKEAYLNKTVNTILQDNYLQNKNYKLLIVDNGRTLHESDFTDGRVRLISNRNFGGSGGFTKGLIEARKEGVYSHFLFMDDDIELDSEVIYRLFSLYEYAKEDFAVAGSMLDLLKKHMLHESGALYNKFIDEQGNIKHSLLRIDSLSNKTDLRNSTSLNSLLRENDPDYGGFWFFAFSKEITDKIGLLLPFFIRVDDIEFGLRTKAYSNKKVVAFPSIAVWHEPFYTKRPVWDIYYGYRNMLITNSIYSSHNYFKTLKRLTSSILYKLFQFDYNAVKMHIQAFEDYLQGPEFIKSNDPEIVHSRICESSKTYKTQTILFNFNLDRENYSIVKISKVQKLLALLTLNGHFLPKFFIKDERVTIQDGLQIRDSVSKGFAKRRLILIYEDNPLFYQNELDNLAGILLLLTWIKVVIKSSWQWSKVATEWKQAACDLTSMQFWQDYLASPISSNKSQDPICAKLGEAI